MDTKKQTRDTFVHNEQNPGSDISAEMSAALSAIAKAFKTHANGTYRAELFEEDRNSSFIVFKNVAKMVEIYETHARWLLDFAEKY